MVYSFYAVMGGFAFDATKANPIFLPGSRSRVCLSLSNLGQLAEKVPDLIPDLPKSDINDKSKASSLAKFLVCLQAFWFCMQCVLRLVGGKSIALLELNIFGHALCALLVYGLWWHKTF